MVKDNGFAQKIHEALSDPSDESNVRFLAFIASFGLGFLALLSRFPDLLASIADGLYLSLSMLKYACEISTERFKEVLTDAKYDHIKDHWLQGPDIWGLVFLLVMLGILLPFSILANNPLKRTEGDKPSFPGMLYDSIQKRAQKLWPYVRNALGGLKNGYTAFISLIFLAQAFVGTTKLYVWANPLAIGVGVGSMANAIWLRKQGEERNNFIKHNEEMMEVAKSVTDLAQLGEFPRVQTHSPLRQAAIYGAVMADALTDGIYLYACLFVIMGLSTVTFPPAILFAAVATLAVMTVLSVITKLYDEHKKACVLELSMLQPQIAYLEKKKELSKLSMEDETTLASFCKRRDELSLKEDNKSLLFFAFRQVVMGFKNASAAGAALLLIPVIGIPAHILFSLSWVAGALYAAYLARPVVKKYMASRGAKTVSSPAVNAENKGFFPSFSFFGAARAKLHSMMPSKPISTIKNKPSFFTLPNVAIMPGPVDELRHFCCGS